MARRTRISWPLAGTLAAAVVVGSGAAVYKYAADRKHEAQFGLTDGYTVELPAATINTLPAMAKPGQLAISTTRPAINIATPLPSPKAPDALPTIKPLPNQAIALSNVVPNNAVPGGVAHGMGETSPRLSADAEKAPAYQLSNAADLFTQADAKIQSNDLIAARRQLVDALDAKKLLPGDQDEAFKRLSRINDTLVFSKTKYASDPLQSQYVVKSGDSMQKIAAQYAITWQLLGKLNGISDPRKLQAGKTLKVIKGPFHAQVNKTAYTLDLYLGKPGDPGAVFVKRFRVGLGENDSTPTGLWAIDTKLEKPRYYNSRDTGPRTVESGDPSNPLGTRWLALSGQQGQAVGKTSYGIHGTIDPTSIGQKKSMGCIRMLNEDVEQVYDILVSKQSTVTVTE